MSSTPELIRTPGGNSSRGVERLVQDAHERALEMLAHGASRMAVLNTLVAAAEVVAGPGCVCSILVLDDDGLLRNGASPNLPPDYLDAIDRLKPDPGLGTCAAAAATGEPVFTPDFCADAKWAELKHLPLSLGFAGAWSMPIKPPGGAVLGTFGTYYRDRREPTGLEFEAVRVLASAAAVAIAQSRAQHNG
jgi:GAF domain-containing protein